VPSVIGYTTVPAIEESEVIDALSACVDALTDRAVPIAHCCDAGAPLAVFRRAMFHSISVDASLLKPGDDDAIGEVVEAGLGLFLGLVPALGPGVPPSVRDIVRPARELWQRLGFPPDDLAKTVVVTPACGLAGASAGWARTALRLVRQSARVLVEAPEVAP
jgi:hypothetical protein